VTIVELPGSATVGRNEKTLSAKTPSNKGDRIFEEQVNVVPDSLKEYSGVFPVPENPTRYRVFARLGNDIRSTFEFTNWKESGFVNVVINISSDNKIEIATTLA